MVAEFSTRESTGLERVYRAYGKALYSVARTILANSEDAEDCVHDVLVRVWQRAGAYRSGQGELRSYLLAGVRNEAIARKRSAARHARIEEHVARSDDLVYDFTMDDAVERGRLCRAIAALPSEQRTALAAAYSFHLTHAEIAQRLGVPLGTIKGRLRLALQKLQAALREG